MTSVVLTEVEFFRLPASRAPRGLAWWQCSLRCREFGDREVKVLAEWFSPSAWRALEAGEPTIEIDSFRFDCIIAALLATEVAPEPVRCPPDPRLAFWSECTYPRTSEKAGGGMVPRRAGADGVDDPTVSVPGIEDLPF